MVAQGRYDPGQSVSHQPFLDGCRQQRAGIDEGIIDHELGVLSNGDDAEIAFVYPCFSADLPPAQIIGRLQCIFIYHRRGYGETQEMEVDFQQLPSLVGRQGVTGSNQSA